MVQTYFPCTLCWKAWRERRGNDRRVGAAVRQTFWKRSLTSAKARLTTGDKSGSRTSETQILLRNPCRCSGDSLFATYIKSNPNDASQSHRLIFHRNFTCFLRWPPRENINLRSCLSSTTMTPPRILLCGLSLSTSLLSFSNSPIILRRRHHLGS